MHREGESGRTRQRDMHAQRGSQAGLDMHREGESGRTRQRDLHAQRGGVRQD